MQSNSGCVWYPVAALGDRRLTTGRGFMQAFHQKSTKTEMPLQLLLFVDKRPSSREQIRQVRVSLEELRAESVFELQVIDVGEQPYLAEHYKLVATPALIKIHPEPRQMLAGTNLVEQIRHWWPYWQRAAQEYLEEHSTASATEGVETREKTPPGWQEPAAYRMGEFSAIAAPTPEIDILHSAKSLSANSAPEMAAKESAVQNAVSSIVRSAEVIQLSDEVFRLKREKEELEHQLRFKDQLIAMLAHDLRNPLTAASIALETLEMGHHPQDGWTARLNPALITQLLKHARTQTKTIDRMITDILQAAKGPNSELEIHPQKLDLKTLCLDVLVSFQDRLAAKSQQVKQDIPSDLPTVLADGERVRQVIVNLLDNAIKYTPIGGTISISCLHRTTQKVQVSVCDNGPGIPEENRERIFEDRFRLQRDEAKEGYGIGLSLCQRIVRAHYGQIWVDSTPQRGSCFHFTLPVFQI